MLTDWLVSRLEVVATQDGPTQHLSRSPRCPVVVPNIWDSWVTPSHCHTGILHTGKLRHSSTYIDLDINALLVLRVTVTVVLVLVVLVSLTHTDSLCTPQHARPDCRVLMGPTLPPPHHTVTHPHPPTLSTNMEPRPPPSNIIQI